MSQSQTAASYESVYNTLRKRILHLDLIPGSLVSEIETAKEFSVSRTPVRDAFKALVNEGLLEVKPHVGTFVTLINMDEISDILYIREVMEKAIIKDLILSFNQSQEFKLRNILHTQKDLIANSSLSSQDFAREFAKSDNAFHKMLFTLTGKANLINYFQTINAQYERFRTFLNLENQAAAQTLYEQHLALLNFIKDKNIAEADKLITHHIYDGFNSKAHIMHEYPHYFCPLK